MTKILFEEVFSKNAIQNSLEFLEQKPDSAGSDGIPLSQLREYWNLNGERVLSLLKDGSYSPGMVKTFDILQKSGTQRTICQFTSTDRLILRCLSDALNKAISPLLSKHCHSFRDGYGVETAVKDAIDYLTRGYRYIIKLDISHFFDSIQIPDLILRLRNTISSEWMIILIEKFLHAEYEGPYGILRKQTGIFQGSPISPILSNLYLLDFDRYYEDYGIPFCRYGDDIIFFFENKNDSRNEFPKIKEKLLSEFHLNIQDKKTVISESIQGKYLGYYFRTESNGSVTAYKKYKKQALIYSRWHKGVVEKVDRNYHIINDGILTKKDYNTLFENESGKQHIPVETVKSINIYSDIVLSGNFLRLVSERKLDVNLFDRYGNAIGRFVTAKTGFRTKTMLNQARIYLSEQSRLEVAKAMEIGAIHNIRANLRYYLKQRKSDLLSDSVKEISSIIKIINECKDHTSLLLTEARARNLYYSCLNDIITREEFRFTLRSRRPPLDPLNALISFGNVFLYNQVATEINTTTLDIRIGFIHSANNRDQSLNLDIAEIFKPIVVDRSIFTLINKNMIHPKEHFRQNDDGGVYLNDEGKRLFIDELYYHLYQKQKDGERMVSFEARIREEIQKIYRYIAHNEKYKPYKYN